jgi:hypothetical protein
VKTNTFTLHHFESITGMVFVINTDPGISGGIIRGNLKYRLLLCYSTLLIEITLPPISSLTARPDLYNVLRHIYAHIFIEYVAKNPLYRYRPDEPLNCPLFVNKMEEYLKAEASGK